VSTWRGSCHCGAVAFKYETAKPPAEWPVRECQCSFCQKHGACYTSDPAGTLRFTHREAAALSRYRFGHHSADFVFCGRCGGYLGAVTEESGKALMVVNLRAIDPPPEGLPAPQTMTYDGESNDDRNLRRSARWTPVRS
jgi:hypothetical protein